GEGHGGTAAPAPARALSSSDCRSAHRLRLVGPVDRQPGPVVRLDPVEAVAVELVAHLSGDAQHLLTRLLDHLVVGTRLPGDKAQLPAVDGIEAEGPVVGNRDRA